MNKEYTVPTWEPGVKQLAPNIYAYIQAKATWYWNNAGFIVGKDYVVVVDSLATVGLTQKFKDEIKKITDKPIRYLINTHHHGDHTYGNHVFAGATVISHDYCRHEVTEAGIPDQQRQVSRILTCGIPFFRSSISGESRLRQLISLSTGSLRCIWMGGKSGCCTSGLVILLAT